MTAPWHAAKPPGPVDPPMDAQTEGLARLYRELVRHSFDNDDRSLQSEIGSSEIGWECDRRIAYKLAGRPTLNVGDPMRAIIGTGFHMWMASKFVKFNRRRIRYLVEYPCVYRDIPGHGDLFDLDTGTVTDWKTTSVAKIREMRRRGVPSYYEVQTQHNAAALRDNGFRAVQVCLKFFPIDSVLDNSWAWRAAADPRPADAAIDRIDRLRGVDPAVVAAHPGRHCSFCDQYDPNSTDLSWSCPAKKGN